MTASLIYLSPVGDLLITVDDTGVTRLNIVASYEMPDDNQATDSQQIILDQAVRWLDQYFAGHNPGALPPLHLEGTAFQQCVWRQLRTIPYGATTTYGALAHSVAAQRGTRSCAQAVGQAVSANPVAIMVPCHRVLRAGRRLGGYFYGSACKSTLLQLEGADFIQ